MKLRKIYTDKNNQEVLRQKSSEVSFPLTKEIKKDLDYLLNYIKLSQDPYESDRLKIRPGVGLAAPQIGVLLRMFAIYFRDEEGIETTYQVINPRILTRSAKKSYVESGEGCLSINTDVEGYAIRNANITISYISYPSLEEKTEKISGYLAIVFQHEIDHLDGILYYDRIDKEDPFKKIDGAIVF